VVGEGRKPLRKRRAKAYFCSVVSEDVEIALKNKPSAHPEMGFF
jgi:hypothetical protein